MESTNLVYKGDVSHQDIGKSPMRESSAILLLLGLFLVAMTPLTLLPLILRDLQGRRRVGWRIALSAPAAGVITILSVLAAMNWDVVAPYAKATLAGTHNVFTVAKQLPGDLVEWLDSGQGLRYLLQGLFIFGFIALLCAWLLPMLQGVRSLKARLTGTNISSEPRTVNKEDMAALRQRQQEELQESAHEKKEVLRQRRLARITEHEQKFQRFGQGVGHYAR